MHRVLHHADAAAGNVAHRGRVQRAGVGHGKAAHDAEIGPGHAACRQSVGVEAGPGHRHVDLAALKGGQDLGKGARLHRAGQTRLLAGRDGDLHRDAGGRPGARAEAVGREILIGDELYGKLLGQRGAGLFLRRAEQGRLVGGLLFLRFHNLRYQERREKHPERGGKLYVTSHYSAVGRCRRCFRKAITKALASLPQPRSS